MRLTSLYGRFINRSDVAGSEHIAGKISNRQAIQPQQRSFSGPEDRPRKQKQLPNVDGSSGSCSLPHLLMSTTLNLAFVIVMAGDVQYLTGPWVCYEQLRARLEINLISLYVSLLSWLGSTLISG